MSISRAKKIKKQTVTDFINAADEPKLIKNETQNIWIKKTYYFKPEKIKQLEILKIEQNDNNEQKKFIQELLDEALELLFEKYRK
ncbi:MAG: ribbon-helix-helix domain-containing protein [Endomicrobiaceae bacterium]